MPICEVPHPPIPRKLRSLQDSKSPYGSGQPPPGIGANLHPKAASSSSSFSFSSSKTLQHRARGREGERGRGDSWLKLALMPRAPPSADMRNTRSHSMLQRIRDSRNHPPNSDDTGKGLKIKRGRQRKEGQLPMLRESLADLPAAAKTPLHSAPGMGKFPHDDRRQSRQEPVDHSRIG